MADIKPWICSFPFLRRCLFSSNDIDYYKVNLGTTAPVFNPVSLTNFKYADTGGNSDNILQPSESAYLDIMVKNNVNASVHITSAVLSTTSEYITLDKSTGTIGNLNAGYYQTLTNKAFEGGNAKKASVYGRGWNIGYSQKLHGDKLPQIFPGVLRPAILR
jgi:hypothetical protein